MDIAFEILIPSEIQLPDLRCKRDVFEWQGQLYPQGLPYCDYGPHFRLVETLIPKHIPSFLPEELKCRNWRCFSVKGEGLALLKEEEQGAIVGRNGKDLEELLDVILTPSGSWVVVFEPNYDRIDRVLHCEVSEVAQSIRASLAGINDGFIAFHQERG